MSLSVNQIGQKSFKKKIKETGTYFKKYIFFSVEWMFSEGVLLDPISEKGNCNQVLQVAKVYGSARNILLGERTALNLLARASGIATK